MDYLARQILVYLLLAALWGFFIGWLIFKVNYKVKLHKIENIWKINVLSLEQQLEELRSSKTGRGGAGKTLSPKAVTKQK
ncbi:MAG TPA: hypothetical protein PLP19_08345 [bacterium]|nr:hypothetical protein [bacterium]HPN43483.1 hypothetical protein [bacterium]